LTRGPRENGHRPSIDALFRSAARTHDSRTIGVLLSGALSDGIDGLRAVKQRGGTAVVQDPTEAMFASMPAGAIGRVAVDYTLRANAIGDLLSTLVGTRPPAPQAPATVPEPASAEESVNETVDDGVPSIFSCPDCGGVLWEFQEGEVVRYRCRVGHAYSIEGLDATQREHLEDALWAALRALDENAELSARMAERAHSRGLGAAAGRFEERARTAREQSGLVRSALERVAGGADVAPEPLRGEVEIAREQSERREEGAS
jgi:two-component system chemotaxis response regulator CheB